MFIINRASGFVIICVFVIVIVDYVFDVGVCVLLIVILE